jgi:hypothetical protein
MLVNAVITEYAIRKCWQKNNCCILLVGREEEVEWF